MKKILELFVTFKCNSKCIFCNTGSFKLHEPSEDSLKMAIRKNNCMWDEIILNGGEPTTRKGIFKIAALAKNNSKSVSIFSNGRVFSSEKACELAINAGIDNFYITIISQYPKVHDYISQVDGALSQSLKGIENIVRKEKKVEVYIPILRQTLEELPNLVGFLAKKGVSKIHLHFLNPQIICLGSNKEEQAKKCAEIIPSLNEARENIKNAVKKAEELNQKIVIGGLPQGLNEEFPKEDEDSSYEKNIQFQNLEALNWLGK